jgi:branched-chain amino acid transport system ATP-binding protein
MPETLLRAEGLSVRYGRNEALRPLSLEAGQGSLTLVLGANGAGKSTLVRTLAGAVMPQTGRVFLAGADITWVPAHQRVRRGIALVPEGRGRLPGLSVKDNLVLGWHAAPRARRGDRAAGFAAALALFPILGDRMEQDCSTLSGGEMQMLAIARALLAKPQLLLLDEPSLGLAPIAVARVYEALAKLVAGGLAMVLVEQKAIPLACASETTIVLQNGRIIFSERRRPTADELAALYLGEGVL